jgi:hypothetical protein
MVQLQKLLGKDDRFFGLLEGSAEQARSSVQALRKFILNPAEKRNLDDFIETRRKDKQITAQINEALCTSFVTVLEAQDIEALSNCVYKIPKTVEKIAERILLAPQHLPGVDLSSQVAMLEKATDTLLQMVKELRRGLTKARVTALNEQLQSVEGEADKAVLDQLRNLYDTQQNPGRVVFLKDIFELMERVTDRCRDAGNVIVQIVLKSS